MIEFLRVVILVGFSLGCIDRGSFTFLFAMRVSIGVAKG